MSDSLQFIIEAIFWSYKKKTHLPSSPWKLGTEIEDNQNEANVSDTASNAFVNLTIERRWYHLCTLWVSMDFGNNVKIHSFENFTKLVHFLICGICY